MNIRQTTGTLSVLLALTFSGEVITPRACGQEVGESARRAYFQAVAGHFEVPVEEVAIIGDWDIQLDEVPVVLFISQRAGVSPDALIGLRRQGRGWMQVADRLGLGMRNFHVPLPADEPLGRLTRIHREFTERPSREWDRIQMDDGEIIFLVNIRVLSDYLDVPPVRVLHTRGDTSDFASCLARLVGPPQS